MIASQGISQEPSGHHRSGRRPCPSPLFRRATKTLSPRELYRIYGQPGDLLHPKAAAEHEHEHGPVSQVSDDGKEPLHLVVLQVPGQRLGQTDRDLRDGVYDRHSFLVDEVVEEEAYCLQVAGDRLRRPSLSQEDDPRSARSPCGSPLRSGMREPLAEVIQDVHVVLDRMGRVVFSLQRSPVPDQLNSLHRSLPSR